MPNGSSFVGSTEFKALLKSDRGRFAEAFTGQLATFALRRLTTRDDQPEITAITASLSQSEYRLRDLIIAFATSELFRKR